MSNDNYTSSGTLDLLLGVLTGIVGYEIHGDMVWAIIDCLVWPFAWIKWLICHEVNWTIIQSAFEFFTK